jgi:hypothetical protein
MTDDTAAADELLDELLESDEELLLEDVTWLLELLDELDELDELLKLLEDIELLEDEEELAHSSQVLNSSSIATGVTDSSVRAS